jgi:hypothetical protein
MAIVAYCIGLFVGAIIGGVVVYMLMHNKKWR